MLERFRKPRTTEAVDQRSLRKISATDSRIKLFTPAELSEHSEYVTVDRNGGGGIEAGWLVVGESDDGTLVEIHRELEDKSTLIKVVSRRHLEKVFQMVEEQKERAALDRDNQIAAYYAEQERLRCQRKEEGRIAASLVKYDEDGLVVVPDWVRQSSGTPQDKVSPSPGLQAPRASQVASERSGGGITDDKNEERHIRDQMKRSLAEVVNSLDGNNYHIDPGFRARSALYELKKIVGLHDIETERINALIHDLLGMINDSSPEKPVSNGGLHDISTRLAKLLAEMAD